MRDIDLFQAALGLTPPWRVEAVEFDEGKGRLDLYIDFAPGASFRCPVCGREDCKAYDTTQKEWRHLNFFQHEAYLHAPVPRVRCSEHGVKQVEVPWARPGSGFTLLFEVFVLALVKEMSVAAVGRLAGEHDTRLWRVLHHCVEEAREEMDVSEVERIGVDETSTKRGHNYITSFVDLDRARVLFATEGRGASTFGRFRLDPLAHGGGAEQIKPENLTKKQRALLDELTPKRLGLKTSRACQMKLSFQELWTLPPVSAEDFLTRWYFWATHSRLDPMIRVAKTLKKHWAGLLNWFHSHISNGILEGINSLIQAAKAKARGYRTTRNLITVLYLIAGKLNLESPI